MTALILAIVIWFLISGEIENLGFEKDVKGMSHSVE